jgi:hypothetical protein
VDKLDVRTQSRRPADVMTESSTTPVVTEKELQRADQIQTVASAWHEVAISTGSGCGSAQGK